MVGTASGLIDPANSPSATVDGEVLPILVDPGTKTGRAHLEGHAVIVAPPLNATTISAILMQEMPAAQAYPEIIAWLTHTLTHTAKSAICGVYALVTKAAYLVRFQAGGSMLRSQLSLILRGIIVVAALALSGGFAAGSERADTVVAGCRAVVENKNTDSEVIYMRGYCLGLVSGVFYSSREICAPAEVTNGQLARVVVQYVDARPARMHEGFKKFALEAMKAAWPCKR